MTVPKIKPSVRYKIDFAQKKKNKVAAQNVIAIICKNESGLAAAEFV